MATRLKYGLDAYNIEVSPELFTPSEARAEYNRLRSIANKRLARLRESEFSGYDIVQRFKGGFGAPRTMSEGDLYKSLQDVARFVSSKTSSVTGIRRAISKEVETLRKHGYTFVNKQNINAFRNFWAEIKANHDTSKLDSEQVADLFRLAEKKKVDPTTISSAFEYWLEHSNQIEKAKPYQGSGVTSADHFEKLLRQRSRRRRK